MMNLFDGVIYTLEVSLALGIISVVARVFGFTRIAVGAAFGLKILFGGFVLVMLILFGLLSLWGLFGGFPGPV